MLHSVAHKFGARQLARIQVTPLRQQAPRLQIGMRRVRYSATFINQLDTLLAQGEPKFGTRVIDEKREQVFDTIDHFLAQFPRKSRDAEICLYTHAITGTPFVVIYDFDDTELRIFYIVHGHTNRSNIDPSSVDW